MSRILRSSLELSNFLPSKVGGIVACCCFSSVSECSNALNFTKVRLMFFFFPFSAWYARKQFVKNATSAISLQWSTPAILASDKFKCDFFFLALMNNFNFKILPSLPQARNIETSELAAIKMIKLDPGMWTLTLIHYTNNSLVTACLFAKQLLHANCFRWWDDARSACLLSAVGSK